MNEKFANWEIQGLRDFFKCKEIVDLVIPVARIVSKNLLNPQSIPGELMSTNHFIHNNRIEN